MKILPADNTINTINTFSLLRVRKSVWLICITALLLSLALPVITTLRQSSAALEAQVAVLPAHPHVGEKAELIVTITQSEDQAALRGPWAQLLATWNMPTMDMGLYRSVVHGKQDSAGGFFIPLELTMAGSWSIHANLQTPGRPSWQKTLQVQVLPAALSITPTACSSDGYGAMDGVMV